MAFCAHLEIARKTAYNWINSYEEFAEAHEIAQDLELNFWENRSAALCSGQELKGFDKKLCDARHLEFRLRTKFHKDYSEKRHVEVSGSLHSNLVLELESDEEN